MKNRLSQHWPGRGSSIYINDIHSGINIKTIDTNNEASTYSRVVKLVITITNRPFK